MPNEFENARNESIRRRSMEAAEAREVSKENEMDAESKKGAAMERADVLIREVKNNRQQVQNLVVHIQEVMKAIAQLRAQLQLAASNDDPASIVQDKEKVAKLKKNIALHKEEILKMKDELVSEQIKELQKGIGVEWGMAELEKKAKEMVEALITRIT